MTTSLAARRRRYYLRVRHEKAPAWRAVDAAIRSGRLEREPCRVCGVSPAMGHHALGYEPEVHLRVEWLCPKHHVLAHRRPDAVDPEDLDGADAADISA